MRKTNETYQITVASPLLRPGITIQTSVSKRYVADTVRDLLDIIRDINSDGQDVQKADGTTK